MPTMQLAFVERTQAVTEGQGDLAESLEEFRRWLESACTGIMERTGAGNGRDLATFAFADGTAVTMFEDAGARQLEIHLDRSVQLSRTHWRIREQGNAPETEYIKMIRRIRAMNRAPAAMQGANAGPNERTGK